MIIDAHVHLFAADTDRFPLHPNAPYQPQPATLEEWFQAADAGRIDAAVLVHPEPYQDDHRYVLHAMAAAPRRFRATCLFDCNCDDSAKRMAELVGSHKGFVAARVHAYRDKHIPQWGSAALRAFWKKAGGLDLMVQVHMVPRFAGEIDKLLTEFPDIPVLIDHLGRPGQGTREEHDGVLRLARHKGCRIKFSNWNEASKDPAPHDDIRPVVRRIAEAFGAGRMIWGGLFRRGLTGAEYAAQMDPVHRLLDFLSLEERAGILGGNAAKLFGFAKG
jgi:predicted TIM-barrel fold metal-dependent hydrolase